MDLLDWGGGFTARRRRLSQKAGWGQMTPHSNFQLRLPQPEEGASGPTHSPRNTPYLKPRQATPERKLWFLFPPSSLSVSEATSKYLPQTLGGRLSPPGLGYHLNGFICARYVYICGKARGGRRFGASWELELQVAVRRPTRLLRTPLRSSARAVCTLNCGGVPIGDDVTGYFRVCDNRATLPTW